MRSSGLLTDPGASHCGLQVDLARTFTGFGLNLCLCDVDTVWINGEWGTRLQAQQCCGPRVRLPRGALHGVAGLRQSTRQRNVQTPLSTIHSLSVMNI